MNLDDVENTKKSKVVFQDSLQSASSIDMVIKLLLAGSLGKIWALLNELQIVENMNLFALKIPGSWNFFGEALENLTNFEFFSIDNTV